MNLPTHSTPRGPDAAELAPAVGAVSVVVPVRNEAPSVQALLESLAQQTLAPFEIIVVDGGSTDETVKRVQAMADAERRIRVIEAGVATPGRGRNIGIREARQAWIALTDAGAWAEREWLQELVAAARRQPDAAVVYGNFEPVTGTFFTRCAALAYVAPKRATSQGWLRGPSTVSMLIRRDVWELVGGFPDLRAGEDLVFIQRVTHRRVRVGWAPAATVWWQLQPSLLTTFRRFASYSQHNVAAGLQRHWHHGVARQYAVAACCCVLAFAHDWRWLLALPAGLALRTARALWRRRATRKGRWELLNPARFFCVLVILVTVDAATFLGWAQALIRKALRSAGPERLT